jgi:RND family efflux transporter MFP subunit
MAKKIVPLLLIAAAVAASVVMIQHRRQLKPSQPQAAPIAVRVVEVEPGPVQLIVHAQGTVEPRTESNLVPEVSGNVVWISPNLVSGGYFEADEPLLRIDNRDYEAAVQRAEATLKRAEAEQDHAQFELERAQELSSQQLISRADLEEKLRASRVAEASLEDAKLVLQTAERDLERTTLAAPFAGLVREEEVDVGQFISRGNPVASVYATDYLEVRLPIADRQLAYLNIPLAQRGELDESIQPKVTLSAEFAGQTQTWTGKLVRTEAQIDPGSRMVYAIARVQASRDGDGNTVPPPVGLFVQAEIEGIAEDNVVVLPRSALRNENQVLVVDTENRLYFRDVDVLRVYRDEVFITGGLKPGELVSVSTLQTVVDGMRVRALLPET